MRAITRVFGLLFWPVMALGLGADFAIGYFRDNETVWPALIASLLCLAVGDIIAEIRRLKEATDA